MAVAQSLTMGDYFKQTDAGRVFRGFVPEDTVNFDIKNYVLSGLRENSFDGNALETHGHLLHAFMKQLQCINQLMSLKTQGQKIGCFAFRME